MSNPAFEDAFNLLCGALIGRGIHRRVFECQLRDDLVVKVEDDEPRRFANVLEFEFWQDHQHHKPVAKWLAPVIFMSPDGRVILQKRCAPLPVNYEMPRKIPGFLTDTKLSNFGMFDGRLVCFDYALTIRNASAKLKKADWGLLAHGAK